MGSISIFAFSDRPATCTVPLRASSGRGSGRGCKYQGTGPWRANAHFHASDRTLSQRSLRKCIELI
jgi:hypothetical protein